MKYLSIFVLLLVAELIYFQIAKHYNIIDKTNEAHIPKSRYEAEALFFGLRRHFIPYLILPQLRYGF
jgi:hypothetical protein